MMELTPFRRILIANRGEIALRVARTARRLGYGVVAVHSEADAGARHVREADQAVSIGEALPAQSYLRADRLITAAKASGADAVHPGYGFLAESPEFARACVDAGLVFIGPSAAAIEAMGNKAAAKAIMAAAGVPCVPGYQGEDQSEAALAGEAKRIGFPIMIKAAAGGGGRGMRLVPDALAFPDLLHSARSEAATAFGDATVILERAIVDPRHIEVQVFGDRYGNAIHLGERDCSVQRRHQKLIEEAPSPAVSPELRARMGAIAEAATKAIRYEGAGTLEFLLDGAGNFYFMEMNTRLQVEHPVTEAITGLDLVELQLRVASGEPLGLRQEDVRFAGHAIEVRLCAEDADRDFIPQSGRMGLWSVPAGLRVEHALESGAEVPPYYDSMIAKIIALGASREEARRRLVRGLEQAVALGVKTNQRFLARCLEHPVFAAGGATTAFVGRHKVDLLHPREDGTPGAVLAALLLYVTESDPDHRRQGRTLAPVLPIAMRFELDGARIELALFRERGGRYVTSFAGQDHTLDVETIGRDNIRFRYDGLAETAIFHRNGQELFVLYRGETLAVHDLTRAAAQRAGESATDGRPRAAMNGRVVAVLVKPGDRVEAGQPMVTLEAMKMEHVRTAPISGTVSAVHVSEGDQVDAGRIMVEIEAA